MLTRGSITYRLTPGFRLGAGVNYLRMRDGTTLSAYVTLPRGPGPFPTVVNYSGYAASRPGEPLKDFEFLCADFPVVCGPPEDGAALFAGMMGYATVSVNMRGTGCSGGAYDYFETLQLLDGYDVIEIVGAQPWVQHHKVGMVGLSYPGISQLFVGAQKPPSLAAITPMSVIGSTTTTLRPGGMLNDGEVHTTCFSMSARLAAVLGGGTRKASNLNFSTAACRKASVETKRPKSSKCSEPQAHCDINKGLTEASSSSSCSRNASRAARTLASSASWSPLRAC
jgi:putative CocE/NonD family hydrolase